MTVKLELHAASTKCSNTYSPELCAVSFMTCLTGWEPVFCKISVSKRIRSSKSRTAFFLYTEASICGGLRSPSPLLDTAALVAVGNMCLCLNYGSSQSSML